MADKKKEGLFTAPRWHEIPAVISLGPTERVGPINEEEQAWWDEQIALLKAEGKEVDEVQLNEELKIFRDKCNKAFREQVRRDIAEGRIKFKSSSADEEN